MNLICKHTLPVAQLLISHTLVGCYCYAGYFSTENTLCISRSLSARMVEKQATILFDSLDKLDQIPKLLKPLNLMVIAPFTGFHVFSTAATCLYIAAYPKKL